MYNTYFCRISDTPVKLIRHSKEERSSVQDIQSKGQTLWVQAGLQPQKQTEQCLQWRVHQNCSFLPMTSTGNTLLTMVDVTCIQNPTHLLYCK